MDVRLRYICNGRIHKIMAKRHNDVYSKLTRTIKGFASVRNVLLVGRRAVDVIYM